MMQAAIQAIEYYLPSATLTSTQLATEFPDWGVSKITEKTGIDKRHIASSSECSSDLGIRAAEKMFANGSVSREEIDFLLFCTQSPDYFLPATACLVQHALGLPKTIGALDFNLGCSGFVYGLSLAKGLIETGQATKVLLITAETYSKFINRRDRSVRTIFGDAAAATLVGAVEAETPLIGPFVFGTDGSGAGNLLVPAGGMRLRDPDPVSCHEDDGNWRGARDLYMNGAELFSFTLREVPSAVKKLLEKSASTMTDFDIFVFHQANRYMLSHLRKGMNIPEDRFYVSMGHCGNTVSSTIPIALRDALTEGRLRPGARLMLAGFGVGYSWGAATLRWI